MDETPLPYSNHHQYTMELKGSRTININSFANEKANITVALAVTMTGEKLKPYLIYKGKRQGRVKSELNEAVDYPEGLQMTCNDTHWMCTADMLDWIDTILVPYIGNRRALFILDSFAVHLEQTVIEKMDSIVNLRYIFVPKKLTSVSQPIDVAVNRPFKANMRLVQGLTQANTYTKVTRRSLAFAVMKSWEAISSESIVNGFKKCGFHL